jgi:hypothetical protein
MSPASRPADPAVTVATPPGDLVPSWAEAVAGVLADYPTLVAAVAELRLRDAKLAVDDAGTGYAGLQHLMVLRPDLVKLDRALVAGCDRDPAKAALIEMLGRFTGQLDAWVLAEGVERTAELESLIRLRVPLAQGYLLGRPAEPWATLPGELAATIRDRQTAQTFQDSVVGLTVDAPWVRAGDAETAAARWFEADPELDVVVGARRPGPSGRVGRPSLLHPGGASPNGPCSRPARPPPPRPWSPGPWPAPPPTASTPWSASTTGATTSASSASNSSSTASWWVAAGRGVEPLRSPGSGVFGPHSPSWLGVEAVQAPCSRLARW